MSQEDLKAKVKQLRERLRSPSVPSTWLRYSTTPDQAERSRLERMATTFNITFEKVAEKFGSRPFGPGTDKWREFVKKLGEGDELWWFDSGGDSWAKKMGCAGYAIVRNGVIRETLVVLEN
jgi:hypothetical protein